jgi:hypothetical protein
MLASVGLVVLGLLVGAYGTLIGAGGGFVLMPILLLLYPWESPSELTAVSLVAVFLNALSGSIAYARMKRIDYRAGLLFAVCGVPGALLGAHTVSWIPRRVFSLVLGGLLVAVAAYLLFRPQDSSPDGRDSSLKAPPYNRFLGGTVSLAVGYLSGVLGIGGGILHVPFLSRVLRFPVHVATATSHFVLAIMAFSATLIHVAKGEFHGGLSRMLLLGVGILIGAQVGAALSKRVRGKWILRGLALAMLLVAIRVLV